MSISLTYLFKIRLFFFPLVLYWVWQQVENATHPLSDHKQSWISEPSLINKGVDQRRRPIRDEARGGKRKQEEKALQLLVRGEQKAASPSNTQESKAKTQASWNCPEWGGSESHFLLQVWETSSIILSCPRAINQNPQKFSLSIGEGSQWKGSPCSSDNLPVRFCEVVLLGQPSSHSVSEEASKFGENGSGVNKWMWVGRLCPV